MTSCFPVGQCLHPFSTGIYALNINNPPLWGRLACRTQNTKLNWNLGVDSNKSSLNEKELHLKSVDLIIVLYESHYPLPMTSPIVWLSSGSIQEGRGGQARLSLPESSYNCPEHLCFSLNECGHKFLDSWRSFKC